METAGDPSAELDMLVGALSEMAKPHGYAVEALRESGVPVALGIMKPGGEWLASMCPALLEDGSSAFPDEESRAAAIVSRYGSRPAWDAYFFCSPKIEILRFPGGSPEELALKAAAGVRAERVGRRAVS